MIGIIIQIPAKMRLCEKVFYKSVLNWSFFNPLKVFRNMYLLAELIHVKYNAAIHR